MRPLSIAASLALLALPAESFADPVGSYRVRGINPGDGAEYTGTVDVTRKEETYRVVWNIAGEKFVGVGTGLQVVDGRTIPGPASKFDTGISIAFGSGKSFGVASYTEAPDGSWQGVWVYKGTRQISTETWTPKTLRVATKSVTIPRKIVDPVAETTPVTNALPVIETTPASLPPRTISSPLPANASPKS